LRILITTWLSQRSSEALYFGRDPLGRRSLLLGSSSKSDLLLCSAASKVAIEGGFSFSELDCSSLWMVDLEGLSLTPSRIPRAQTQYTSPFRLKELLPVPSAFDASGESACKQLLSVLSDSVRKRVCHLRLHGNSQDAQVAVLFSGGLDCTTLALLAHHHIESSQPIDLLNVAFENPRVLQAKSKTEASANGKSQAYDVPDRKTGRQSFEELQRVAPNRRWNFVEVNVSHAEYIAERETIETLMAPCHSVMDLSIAAALYFASRGRSSNGYTSTAKVLLSGLGADELLGGYSRHRKAFARDGKQGLVEELQMDLDRLSTRNLGRDDRILSSSGKEARYPFLSHSVITFLAALPVEVKMDFVDLPAGQGDKKLLREVARSIGLQEASVLVKRAIQFGARSAKMEVGDGKIMGHERLRG
jgi:asparagine synthetase B (glutamine-hydrolysing)